MGIGLGIVLLVVGAVLTFALDVDVSGIDLDVVGYICMGAGALSLILALVLNGQRARTRHTEVIQGPDGRTVDGRRPTDGRSV